jgi:hypothetical protein
MHKYFMLAYVPGVLYFIAPAGETGGETGGRQPTRRIRRRSRSGDEAPHVFRNLRSRGTGTGLHYGDIAEGGRGSSIPAEIQRGFFYPPERYGAVLPKNGGRRSAFRRRGPIGGTA